MAFETPTTFPRVFACKITTLILGIIILGVGLHSHFDSGWVKEVYLRFPGFPDKLIIERLYEVCSGEKKKNVDNEKCPDISMEHYFISIIIITFTLSLSGMAMLYFSNDYRDSWRQIDMWYHAIGALALLAGAIVYLVSAKQIQNIEHILQQDDSIIISDLRTPEKLAAGSLTVFQAVLFGATSFLIYKQGNEVERLN